MDHALVDLEREAELEEALLCEGVDEQPIPVKQSKPNQIYLLFPSVFLGGVSLFLLAPLLPTIKVKWFDYDFALAQQVSGIVSSVTFLISCLCSPFLGKLSDRYGRKPLMRINNIGSALPILALFLTNGDSALAYYGTVIVCGVLTAGQSFIAVAYVADSTVKEDRAKMFGYLGAMTGVVFTVTPFLVGTLFKEWANTSLFLLSLVLSLLNAAWIELVLPESLEPKQQAETVEHEEPKIELSQAQRTFLFWLCTYVFVTRLPMSGTGEIVFIYLNDVLKVGSEEMRQFTSSYLFLTGVAMFVSQTLYIRMFAPKTTDRVDRLLIVASTANVLHLWVYFSLAFTHSLTHTYLNIIITSFMMVDTTATNALISKRSTEREQGYMLGRLDAVRSFVSSIGPVLFSFLYAYFGEHHDYPQAPFLFGALFCTLAIFVVLGPLRRREDE